MTDHLFSVGELVSFDTRGPLPAQSDNVFTVRLQMPPVGTELQYRIKSIGEPYDRVVPESRLSRFTFSAPLA